MLQNERNHMAWKNFHVTSIAIVENVVLNVRRSKSFAWNMKINFAHRLSNISP